MAGRRGQKDALKTGIDSSTMIYVSMAGVLIVLTFALYTFGIDFGFVHFGGTPNVNILYGGAVACIVLSFVIDILYIRAIKRFYKDKNGILTYIPYVNFIGVFSNKTIIGAWILIAVACAVMIPAFTTLGQYMPVDYLVFFSMNSVFIIIGIMVAFSILRGYYCLYFKRQVDEAYRTEISENYGSGGGLNYVSYIIYFLPIIRGISLFTDLNFINTVKSELDEMRRGEER